MNEKQHQKIEKLSVERAVEAANSMTDYDKKGEAAKELIQKLKNNKLNLTYESRFKEFFRNFVSIITISGAVFGGSYLAMDKLAQNPTPQTHFSPIEVIIKQYPLPKIDIVKLEDTVDKFLYQRTRKEKDFIYFGTYNGLLEDYAKHFYGSSFSVEEKTALDKTLRKHILDFNEPDAMVKYWNKRKKKLVLLFHYGLDRPILFGD